MNDDVCIEEEHPKTDLALVVENSLFDQLGICQWIVVAISAVTYAFAAICQPESYCWNGVEGIIELEGSAMNLDDLPNFNLQCNVIMVWNIY